MTKIKYKIKTNVRGNPDHGQNPYQTPYGVENITITAPTIKELQNKVNKWQGENNIGGGNWKDPKVFENKICIGEMSYNGTIIKINEELIASKYKELTWYEPKNNAKETA